MWKFFAYEMASNKKGKIQNCLNTIKSWWKSFMRIKQISDITNDLIFQFFILYILFYVVFLTSITALVLLDHSPSFSIPDNYKTTLILIFIPIVAASIMILVLKHVFIAIYSWELYKRYKIYSKMNHVLNWSYWSIPYTYDVKTCFFLGL